MFGASFFNDPFYGDIGSQMREMQSMHEQMMHGLMGFRGAQPMLSYGQPHTASTTAPGGAVVRRNQIAARRQDPFGFPDMGSIFSHMNSMMGSMGAMTHQLQSSSDPNTQFYSSSSVMSFSNTGNGAPKVYQASSSTRQGPGGVREVRKMERNSSTGIERIHHGRHIGERGHVVQRQRNVQSGDREENIEYLNLDEEEAPGFEQEWQQTARSNQRAVADARSRPSKYESAPRYVPSAMNAPEAVISQKAKIESRKPTKKVTINSARNKKY